MRLLCRTTPGGLAAFTGVKSVCEIHSMQSNSHALLLVSACDAAPSWWVDYVDVFVAFGYMHGRTALPSMYSVVECHVVLLYTTTRYDLNLIPRGSPSQINAPGYVASCDFYHCMQGMNTIHTHVDDERVGCCRSAAPTGSGAIKFAHELLHKGTLLRCGFVLSGLG